MGNALQQCGRYTQAIDAYDFAIAIESAFGPAYHQKAEALVAMERYQDALHTYEETLTFEDPRPARVLHGRMPRADRRFGTRGVLLPRQLETGPRFADAFVGLGVLADMQGRLGEACSYFEQALEIEPKHADYHLLLATCLKNARNTTAPKRFTPRGWSWISNTKNSGSSGWIICNWPVAMKTHCSSSMTACLRFERSEPKLPTLHQLVRFGPTQSSV